MSLHVWQCSPCICQHECVAQVLVTYRPESTTALLMRLCTVGDASTPDGEWLAKVADYAHLYSDR